MDKYAAYIGSTEDCKKPGHACATFKLSEPFMGYMTVTASWVHDQLGIQTVIAPSNKELYKELVVLDGDSSFANIFKSIGYTLIDYTQELSDGEVEENVFQNPYLDMLERLEKGLSDSDKAYNLEVAEEEDRQVADAINSTYQELVKEEYKILLEEIHNQNGGFPKPQRYVLSNMLADFTTEELFKSPVIDDEERDCV